MDPKNYAEHGSEDYNSVTAAGCERDGEPVFTLRAQDVYAASTVRYWASLVRQADGDTFYGEAQAQLAREAEAIAADMDDWPTHKVPD